MTSVVPSSAGPRRCVAVVAALAILCASCAGLPPKPKPAAMPAAAPLSDYGAAGGQWPAAEWWTRYHDDTLDRLVAMALESSPTLRTARARFDSARASVRIAGAATGAHIDAVGDADRQRLSNNGVFPPKLLGFYWYNLYDLGLQANYTFDWWGKQKDTVDAALDDAHAAQADRTAASLMLASSVADAYFGWQADQSRLAVAREREGVVEREGGIMAARIRADLESADEAQRTTSALAAVREEIATLEGSARLRVVTLASLTGRPATAVQPLVPRPLPELQASLPDDAGIDLLSRRADITASRWRVEAAEKSRDSARAEFYPDVSINGLLGVQSIDIGNLLNYGSRVPQVAAAIHLPIFDQGRLKARYGAAQAAIDSAVSSYQETLVEAARDVATQAASRAQVMAERSQRVIEVAAAEQLKNSAAARVRQGVTDSRTELSATESWLSQRDALSLS